MTTTLLKELFDFDTTTMKDLPPHERKTTVGAAIIKMTTEQEEKHKESTSEESDGMTTTAELQQTKKINQEITTTMDLTSKDQTDCLHKLRNN